VDLIGQLLALEQQAKDGSVAERLASRQTQSAPVLAELAMADAKDENDQAVVFDQKK
jgi:hypothetical protein